MKKLMTEPQLLQVLDTMDPAMIGELERKMAPVTAENMPAGHFAAAVARGEYKVCKILDGNQKPLAVMWYWVSQGSQCLVCNAAVSLCEHDNVLAEVIAGCKIVARRHNCKTIEWNTSRAGLVRRAQQFGFKISGVNLTLKV